MHIFFSTLYIALILQIGYTILCILFRGAPKTIPEIGSLSFGFGIGALGLILFYVSLAGLRPSRSLLIMLAILSAGLLFLAYHKQWLVKPFNLRPHDGPEVWMTKLIKVLTVVFLLILVLVISVHSLAFPLYEWDAFSIWGLKAKVLYHTSLLDNPGYFYDVNLSYSHLDYPLALPFIISGNYAAMGNINDQWGKAIFPLLFLAFTLLLFAGFREKLDELKCLLLVAICIGSNTVVRWAGSGNADLLLTFFYGGSVFYLIRWLEKKDLENLVICSLFSAFCAFTKNEGLALAGITLIALFLNAAATRDARALKAAFIFAGILVFCLWPWLIYRMGIPKIHENYIGRLDAGLIIGNLDRLKLILPHFIKEIVSFGRWGGIWVLTLALAVFGMRAITRREVFFCWLLLIMHLCLYILIFLITPWDMAELLHTALDRLLMHVVPVAGLLASLHWANIGDVQDALPLKIRT